MIIAAWIFAFECTYTLQLVDVEEGRVLTTEMGTDLRSPIHVDDDYDDDGDGAIDDAERR